MPSRQPAASRCVASWTRGSGSPAIRSSAPRSSTTHSSCARSASGSVATAIRLRLRRSGGRFRCTFASATPRRHCCSTATLPHCRSTPALRATVTPDHRQRRRARLLPGGVQRRTPGAPRRRGDRLAVDARALQPRRRRLGGHRGRDGCRQPNSSASSAHSTASASTPCGRRSPSRCRDLVVSSTTGRPATRSGPTCRELATSSTRRTRRAGRRRGRPHQQAPRAARRARSGCSATTSAVQARCREWFEAASDDPTAVDPELIAAATSVVAATGDATDLRARCSSASSPARRRRSSCATSTPSPSSTTSRWSSQRASSPCRPMSAPRTRRSCCVRRSPTAATERPPGRSSASTGNRPRPVPEQHDRAHGRLGQAVVDTRTGRRHGAVLRRHIRSNRPPRPSSRSSNASGSTPRSAPAKPAAGRATRPLRNETPRVRPPAFHLRRALSAKTFIRMSAGAVEMTDSGNVPWSKHPKGPSDEEAPRRCRSSRCHAPGRSRWDIKRPGICRHHAAARHPRHHRRRRRRRRRRHPRLRARRHAGPSSFAGQTLTNLEVRPAGTEDVAIGPVPSFDVPASGSWTVVAHLDAEGTPTITPFENDTSAAADGQGRLTVRHTAAAPAVDIVLGDARPVENLSNPNEASLDLPAGEIAGAQIAPTGGDPIGDVPTVYGRCRPEPDRVRRRLARRRDVHLLHPGSRPRGGCRWRRRR